MTIEEKRTTRSVWSIRDDATYSYWNTHGQVVLQIIKDGPLYEFMPGKLRFSQLSELISLLTNIVQEADEVKELYLHTKAALDAEAEGEDVGQTIT